MHKLYKLYNYIKTWLSSNKYSIAITVTSGVCGALLSFLYSPVATLIALIWAVVMIYITAESINDTWEAASQDLINRFSEEIKKRGEVIPHKSS